MQRGRAQWKKKLNKTLMPRLACFKALLPAFGRQPIELISPFAAINHFDRTNSRHLEFKKRPLCFINQARDQRSSSG
jgi:hypothetical protein